MLFTKITYKENNLWQRCCSEESSIQRKNAFEFGNICKNHRLHKTWHDDLQALFAINRISSHCLKIGHIQNFKDTHLKVILSKVSLQVQLSNLKLGLPCLNIASK